VKPEATAALDRIFATRGVAKDAAPKPAHETMRAGDALAGTAPTVAARETRTTAPFLPSITLADGRSGAAPPESTADLLLVSVLGEGGMGVVHAAEQRSLDRGVAVKRPLAETGGAHLVEEARTMAHVAHPNVVPVYALGRDAREQPVLVMKRVEGAGFRALLRDPDHPAWPRLLVRWGDRQRAALAILAEVADALELAHARGIVHRDVKPENVMVGEFGEVYLLDWGIARRMGAPPVEAGGIFGTPGYMAPEMVLEPDEVDARADVYLLGATLHEILTGHMRHEGESLYQTLASAIESVPFAYGPDVPDDLATLANAATSQDRAARPRSAAAFRQALDAHERHREANALVAGARATLAPLRDGTIAVGDEAAAPLLSEASAALAAAARVHAEGTATKAAREELIVLSIERDLALESPAAARAHLAQLAAPPAELAARIDALDAKIARAKASDAQLARERAEADASTTLGVRALSLLAVAVPIVGATALLAGTGALGGAEVTMRGIVTTDFLGLGLALAGAALARRPLFANRGNRRLTLYGLAGLAAIASSNLLSLAVGRAPNEALAHTHVLIAAYFAAGAVALHPAFAVGVPLTLATAAALVSFPAQLAYLSPLGMIAVMGVAIGGVLAAARSSRAR
jgi:serine/threonine-protein kinase